MKKGVNIGINRVCFILLSRKCLDIKCIYDLKKALLFSKKRVNGNRVRCKKLFMQTSSQIITQL